MLGNLTGWHLIIILVVLVLLFGAAKLPVLARSVGQSARVFKGEMRALKDDDTSTGATRASSEFLAEASPDSSRNPRSSSVGTSD